MTLADAVAEYVALRRSRGSPSLSTEATLRLFCKSAGPITLEGVTASGVNRFVHSGIAPATQCSRFSGVKCFLEQCNARGLLPALHLTSPPKPRHPRTPFIFTHAQVKAMLRTADRCQHRAFDLDGRTLRMAVLLLYATGATLEEVLLLRVPDFDKRKRTIHFDGTATRPKRTVPIGRALTEEMSVYTVAKQKDITAPGSPLLLTSLSGQPLRRGSLCERFKKLQRLSDEATASVQKQRESRVGRLQDLRYTFAVHRLKEWIAASKDLSKLMPALSSYMGYASLMKSEDFLAYTPERFHSDLRKLTHGIRAPHWTGDEPLLRFLSGL